MEVSGEYSDEHIQSMTHLADAPYSRPSYLFDPVQVPSPGYVNEVSGCKLEEEDAMKFKGKPGGAVPVQHHDLQQRAGARRTASRGRAPQGPPPPGDTGGGPWAEKTAAAANGIGPAGDPGPPQEGTGAGASPAHGEPPTQPSPERGGTDRALPASGEAPVVGNGGSGAPSQAECPSPQIPAPDYPPPRGSAGGGADRAGKEEAAQRQAEAERAAGAREPGPGSCGSLPGAAPAKEEDRAPAGAARSTGWGAGPPGGASGAAAAAEEEDREVAEALAALAAATAGEEDAEDAD